MFQVASKIKYEYIATAIYPSVVAKLISDSPNMLLHREHFYWILSQAMAKSYKMLKKRHCKEVKWDPVSIYSYMIFLSFLF